METSFTKIEDESFDDADDLTKRIAKLSVENENYKQQLHDLQRKLDTISNMQSELVESNEALEQTLKNREAATKKKIAEEEEKHNLRTKELLERIEEIESELTELTNQNKELQEKYKTNDEILSSLRKAQFSTTTEDNSESLKYELEELNEKIAQEAEIRKELEAKIENDETQFNEMREILNATKKQLAEKNEVLESMEDKLSHYRMELEACKTVPEDQKSKGNSLFAEVEDRRKMMLEQMNAMRKSYVEAKRSFQAKEAEIKALRAERAVFIRKWELDAVEKVQQKADLLEKYRARIVELENCVAYEKKKNIEMAKTHTLPENSFSYLQYLVDSKTKEIEELRMKIEKDAIRALLEEEMKFKMGKQLRYWRFKAMTVEAELLEIKNRLESDPSSSKAEMLETIKSVAAKANETESSMNFEEDFSIKETTIINDTIPTLKSLMIIPTLTSSSSTKSESSDNNNFEKTNETLSESLHENEFASIDSVKITEVLSAFEEDNSANKNSELHEKIVKITQEKPKMQEDSSLIKQENNERDESVDTKPILKSSIQKPNCELSAILSGKEAKEKDKKTLRFTEDTIDPPNKVLKKVTKPNYPIVFISSKKPS